MFSYYHTVPVLRVGWLHLEGVMHLQANIYLLYTTTTMMTITQWQRHKSKDIYAIERLYRDSVARFSVPIKTRYHLKTSWTSFADDFRSQSSKFSWPRRRGLRRHGTSYCSLRINTLISPDLFFKVRESRQKCTVLLLVSAKSLSWRRKPTMRPPSQRLRGHAIFA